ncbi:MAG: hypothetical protein EZS28_025913 [Streblomastix strix]|uniref:Uncharacterized protein n=1 Tax=Streblomastix strix TaxID=222440 RepID=A0A5J4V7B4_9EUKA|nr:MAG: hypothetical protein EZS28_025913 [Streblomastix strix]
MKEITENKDEDETNNIDDIDESQPFKLNTGDQFDLREQLSFYNPDKALKDYRDEKESHKSLVTITMRSLAYDIMYDQLQAQARVKNMINNSVGIGDPSLVAITNVNAQIAAAQDIGTREEPINQKTTGQIIPEQGNEKQKEQVYEQDKEFLTINEQEELGNDVLLGVPPASSIVAPQPTQYSQEQPSLIQEEAEQQKNMDLQSQQMIDNNKAMNYKLGSMDWGLNSINAAQLPQKRITEKINQVQLKKNYISEKQMLAQIEAQKELKTKYDKKQLKKKGKSK